MVNPDVIERSVWIPVVNPWSGKRVNVRAVASERLLVPEEIAELQDHFALPSARNAPDAYHGTSDD